jgi:cytoskeletal protein CcmA (bactofilin family)
MLKKFNYESETNGNDDDVLTYHEIGHQEKPASSHSKTIIGEHISIEGTIRANEDLLIQGKLKGSLELKKHHAVIGPQGKVEADIFAEAVTISGKVTGKVSASGKVSLTKDADFTGQITSRSIAIEDGAFVKATIEMNRNDDAAKQNKVTKGPTDAVILDKKDNVQVGQDTKTKQKI